MVAWYLVMLYSAIASYVVGSLLATFPEDVAPDDSDPFSNPQSAPTYPVPIVFGTRRIRGVNTLWYGNIRSAEITKSVKAGLTSKDVTIGYYYYVAIHLGISYGFLGMVFKSLYIGEDLVYDETKGHTDIASGSTGWYNNITLYGGREQGGGVQGLIRFYDGVTNLEIPPVLFNSLQQDQLPHYKNLANITISNQYENRGMYIGTQKQVRPMSVVIGNTLFHGGYNTSPYTDGVDVNPVTILRHILIGDDRFLTLTGSEVDLIKLDEAEQLIWDEGILCSPVFYKSKTVEKMIETILKLIDAVFYPDPLTGLLTLTLMRELSPTGNEITINSSNLIKVVKHKKPERSTVINEVKLTYTDRTHNYESRTITAQDLAGFITAGQVHNTKTITYSSICTNAVARQICDRDLMQLSKPVSTFDLEVTRVLAQSRIGDQLIIDLPEYGVEGDYYRIANIDYGNLEKGSILVNLISDVYTGNIAVYSDDSDGIFTDPRENAVVELTDIEYIPVPRGILRSRYYKEFWGSGTEAIGAPNELTDYGWAVFPVLPVSDVYHVGDAYRLFWQVPEYRWVVAVSPTPKALLVADLSKEQGSDLGYFDNTGSVRIKDLDFHLTHHKYATGIKPIHYAYMGGEWFIYSRIIDEGNNEWSFVDLMRGSFDTAPKAHLADDVIILFSHTSDYIYNSVVDYPDTIDIKLNPTGMYGSLLDEDDPDVETQITHVDTVPHNDRSRLPLPVHWLKFNGQFYRNTGIPLYTEDTAVTWRRGSRYLYDSLSEYGHIQLAPDSVDDYTTYTVEVYAKDAVTLLRTFVGDGTLVSYTYTKAMEWEDHGQYDNELWFKIISVDTHTLELDFPRGDCFEPRFEPVYYAGYGFNYGNTYGN